MILQVFMLIYIICGIIAIGCHVKNRNQACNRVLKYKEHALVLMKLNLIGLKETQSIIKDRTRFFG